MNAGNNSDDWEQTSWQPGNRPGDGWSGSPERRVLGQDGLATQIACSVRSNQEGCYDESKCTIPPGDRERWAEEMDLTETNRNAQLTLSRCICSKRCKNQRGLKIHQSRMKCLEGGNR